MPILVRRAEPADAVAASVVLADAFTDYAWTRWTVAADDHGERIRALQQLAIDRLVLPFGEMWIASDASGAPAGVALWMLPTSVVPDRVGSEMAEAQASLEGDRHDAAAAAEAFVARLRPAVPHYYLGAVGTRRDHQRRGYGAAVLAPVLDRAAQEGAPVFLETSASENADFYATLGFATVAEVDVPGGGPHVWAMAR